MRNSKGNTEFYENLFEKYRKLNESCNSKLKIKNSKSKSNKSTTSLFKLRKDTYFSDFSTSKLNKSDKSQPKLKDIRPLHKKLKIKASSSKKLSDSLYKPITPKKVSEKSCDRADIKTDDLTPNVAPDKSVGEVSSLHVSNKPANSHYLQLISNVKSKNKSPKFHASSLGRKVNFINNQSGKRIFSIRNFENLLPVDKSSVTFKISGRLKEGNRLLQ